MYRANSGSLLKGINVTEGASTASPGNMQSANTPSSSHSSTTVHSHEHPPTSPFMGLSDEARDVFQRELELLNLRIAAERATVKLSNAIIHHARETHDQLKGKYNMLNREFSMAWKDHQLDIDQVIMLNNKMPYPPLIGAERGTSIRITQPRGYDGLPEGGPSSSHPEPSLIDEYDELRLGIWNFDERGIKVFLDAYVKLDRKIRPIEKLLGTEGVKVVSAELAIEKLEARKLVVERVLGLRV